MGPQIGGTLALLAVVLFAWVCLAYAGAGRGDLRGHAGEYPATANALHLIGLVATRSVPYEFFTIHLVIAITCLLISLLTINVRATERPSLVLAVRVAYGLGYLAMISLVVKSWIWL